MCCPPVHGDNPRALVSGLSYVQVDKHGITILYHLISVELEHHEIFCAKVGKGGINRGSYMGAYVLYRGSNRSAHVLLNLLNKFRKRHKLQGL